MLKGFMPRHAAPPQSERSGVWPWRGRGTSITGLAMFAAALVLAGCGGDPAEADDEAIYAWSRSGSFDLYIDRLGSEPRALVIEDQRGADTEADEYYPAFSPDGSRLAFVSTRDNDGDASVDNELYLGDADGGDVERLTSDGLADVTPAWSPDGESIVFSRGEEGRLQLWLYDLAGRALRQLTRGGPQRVHPSFSPDGRRLAFAQGAGIRTTVWTSAADGSDPVRLTPPGFYDMDPAFSPDGEWIAVSRMQVGASGPADGVESTRGDRDIVLVRADGSDTTRAITSGPDDDREPAFSPDEQSLAFVRRSASGTRANVLIVPTEGGREQELTTGPGLALSPDWRP